MAFQKEVWTKDIQEQLFSGVFGFVRQSVNHDMFVDNKTVHIPQGGTIGNIEKNRSVLPGTIIQRTDTDGTYNLNEYTTDPVLITDLEKIQASYDKRMSLMNQQVAKINARIADESLYAWAAATSAGIISTTGTATANIAPPVGTGNRNLVTLFDIAQCAAFLDEQDVPMEGRYMVMPSKMYWSFVNSEKAQLLSLDFNRGMTGAEIAMGVVSKIYGFNMIVRSNATVYANAGTAPKAVGAAGATGDRFGAVAWQSSCVCNALGAIKPFFTEDSPEYYGSIYSALVMHGSAKARADLKGIVTLVQA